MSLITEFIIGIGVGVLIALYVEVVRINHKINA
jgi:hypothetical protein